MTELDPRQPNKPNLFRRFAALGAVAIAVVGSTIYQNWDRSGDIISYGPKLEGHAVIDDKLNILSWNMHNETSEELADIEEIIDQKDIDVVALQEVSARGAKKLSQYFPEMYIKFAIGDAKTKVFEGGYGNLLMTTQEQRDTTSVAIEGNPSSDVAVKVAGAFVTDLSNFDPSLKETGDTTQEDRTAIASTIEVLHGSDTADVRVVTAHIAGNIEVHDRQFGELRSFVEDNIEDGQATVICGDFNAAPTEVIPIYTELGFIVPETGPTSIGGNVIDFCAYRTGEVLSFGHVEALPGYQTDHIPLLATLPAQRATK